MCFRGSRRKGCGGGGRFEIDRPKPFVSRIARLDVDRRREGGRLPFGGCTRRTKPRNGDLESVRAFESSHILRKEVIQPQVPLRLPCYDFTPVADLTVDGCLLAVSAPASGKTNSHGVTGGVYKARERIHRGMLIHDY